MKPLLFALLAASLAANVALLVTSRRSAAASAPVPGTATTTASVGTTAAVPAAAARSENPTIVATKKAGDAAAAATPAATAFTWSAVETDQDLQRVVAGLRAAGYPPAVVRAVVNQLLNERFAARSPTAGQPFWKRGTPNPETVAAQTALSRERQALFESLLGPDARASSMMDADSRERRYGSLADDKIDAIARIERDYSEMTSEAWAKRRGNALTNSQAMMQTQQLMEKEKLADLAAVLSPAELAEYEMRNSPAARTLINNLRNVEITAPEYAQLYQAQKAFEDANPRVAVMDQNIMAQRQAAQNTLNEQTRTLLGDERFYAYLEGADFQYANVARSLTAVATVTPSASYQVYKLQNELQAQLAQAGRSGQPSPDKMEALRTTVESFHTQLVGLIGAEAAEAYSKQGNGRIFTSFRAMPRTGTVSGPATSLVPVAK